MKQYLGVAILLSIFTLVGCNNSNKTKKEQPSETKAMVGNDADEHGCKASAGYQWSAMQKKCIRPFTLPLKMTSVDNGTSTSGAFAQFNADSTKVELFATSWPKGIILERRKAAAGYVWNVEDDSTPNLKQDAGIWTLSQGGKLIYQEKKK